MTSPRGRGAEAQRYEPQTQRAANQLVQLLHADSSEDLEDKTPFWERMMNTYEEQTGQVFAEEPGIGSWLSNAQESAIKTHMLHAHGAGQTSAKR